MTPARTQEIVQHERMVLTAVIDALKAAFTDNYPEDEFSNLNVVPDYAIKAQQYPALVVSYEPGSIDDAGVGHVESFYDDNGVWRNWSHRKVDGTVTFSIHTISALDRIVFSDALVDLLSFGKLDAIKDGFFTSLYGTEPAGTAVQPFLAQLILGVGSITPLGRSEGEVPWEAEDANIFSAAFQVPVLGGFYNVVPEGEGPQAITKVTVIANEDNQTYSTDDNGPWSFPFVYEDAANVVFTLSANGTIYRDADSVTFTISPATTAESHVSTDSGDVGFTITPFGVNSRQMSDAGEVTFTVAPSGSNSRVMSDAAEVTFAIAPSTTAESRTMTDAADVGITFTIQSAFVDAGEVTFTVSPENSYEWAEMVDAAEVTFTVGVSSVSGAQWTDAGTISFTVAPSSAEVFTPGVHVTTDAGTVTMTITPSSVEVMSFYDVDGDVRFVVTPSSTEVYKPGLIDAAEVTFSITPRAYFNGVMAGLSPTSRWKLNELTPGAAVTATDAMGANNGTYITTGTTYPVSVAGVGLEGSTGTAINTNNISHKGGAIQIPFAASLVPAHISVFGALMIPGSGTGGFGIIWGNQEGTDKGVILGVAPSYTSGAFNGNVQITVGNSGFAGGSGWGGFGAALTGVDGAVPHSAAFTYDGSTLRIYFDGVQVSSGSPGSGWKPVVSADSYIGAFKFAPETAKPGFTNTGSMILDEVALFGTALSAYNVKSLHDALRYGSGH